MADPQKTRERMSQSHQRKTNDSLESLARDFEEFKRATNERLEIGDQRMTRIELAAEGMRGSVERAIVMLPQIMRAETNGLVTFLKTQNTIAAGMREGKDFEKTPANSTVVLPGGVSWRSSPKSIGIVIVVGTMLVSLSATVAYIVVSLARMRILGQ